MICRKMGGMHFFYLVNAHHPNTLKNKLLGG